MLLGNAGVRNVKHVSLTGLQTTNELKLWAKPENNYSLETKQFQDVSMYQSASPCNRNDIVDTGNSGKSLSEYASYRAFAAYCCRRSDMHVKLRRSRFYWGGL